MDWLNFAKEFQTAIVGIIGFSGVIFSQLVNGHLARQRDEAALVAKKRAITTAVRAELTMFHKFFSEAGHRDEFNADGLLYWHRQKRPISPALIEDIGLLESEAIESVLYALLTIDSADSNMSLFAHHVTETHLGFRVGDAKAVSDALNDAAKALKTAIEKIDNSL